MVQAIVISLPGEHARKTFQQNQLSRLGIKAEFIDATTPETLPKGTFDRFFSAWARPMQPKEIALTHSHSVAWRRVIEANRPLLILEDDAVLSLSISDVLNDLFSRNNLELVSLETYTLPKLVGKKSSPLNVAGYSLTRLYWDRGGAAACIVWPSATRKLLKSLKNSYPLADAAIQLAPNISRHQIVPACAIQAMFVNNSDPFFSPDMEDVRPTTLGTVPRPKYTSTRQWLRCRFRRLKISFALLGLKMRAFGVGEYKSVNFTNK